MYVCICNQITESDIAVNPELLEKIGSQCGKCMEDKMNKEGFVDGNHGFIEKAGLVESDFNDPIDP